MWKVNALSQITRAKATGRSMLDFARENLFAPRPRDRVAFIKEVLEPMFED